MKRILFLVGFMTIFVPLGHAGKLTFSSYYPAPSGSYQNLRLAPRPTMTGNCPVGTLYYDSTAQALRSCQYNAVTGNGEWAPFQGVFKQTTTGYVTLTDPPTDLIVFFGKGAARIGKVSGSQWDVGNIGSYSTAFGYNNTASNNYTAIGGGGENRVTAQYGTIGGGYNNFVETIGSAGRGTICGGDGNAVHTSYSTVCGGQNNVATGTGWETVGGGSTNQVQSINNWAMMGGTISGGWNNKVGGGDWGYVGAGRDNTIEYAYGGVISGGQGNYLFSNHSAIVGGQGNQITGGSHSFVGGGSGNIISNSTSVIAGGSGNNTNGASGAIGGGSGNIISNAVSNATIAGGNMNKISGAMATIGGGSGNSTFVDTNNTVPGGDQATISGGIGNRASGQYSTIGGGRLVTASGVGATIAGGSALVTGTIPNQVVTRSYASGDYSTIGGGQAHTASGLNSGILGGLQNTASGQYTAVLGGYGNKAVGDYSVVGGGGASAAEGNQANGTYGFIGNGYYNIINGNYSVIAGGWSNRAPGNYAFLGGGRSEMNHPVYGGRYDQTAGGDYSVVVGGQGNQAFASHSSLLGGYLNVTSTGSQYSAIAGGSLNTIGPLGTNSFIAGGSNYVNGPSSMAIGQQILVDSDNSIAMGRFMNLTNTADRTFVWGYSSSNVPISTSDAFIIYSGNVGVGTVNPTAKLDVVGNIKTSGCLQYNGGTLGVCASDKTLKKNILPISNSLARISQLQPVTFSFKDLTMGVGERQYGFIAQDVEKVYPEWVSQSAEGYKTVNYGLNIDMELIQATKELLGTVEDLKSENLKLKSELEEQQKAIEELRTRIK